MNGIRLYSSNRLEILAEALADMLTTPLSDPLEQEIIVVQSRGMERWLSMQLARHHGICANCRFPFPNAFVYEVFRKAIPDLPERSPFEPMIMTWKIMKLLLTMVSQTNFEVVHHYLTGGAGGLKGFQLAEQVANLFDQYLLFRPEMILAWQQGQDEHWQADLWRALAEGCENQHRAALARHFLEQIENSYAIPAMPERVSIFGISALPRFHLQVISAIASITEVSLFLMNPCRQYWGDIASTREIRRALSDQLVLPEEVYLERGNSLLSSMGLLGRDFWDAISEFQVFEHELFQEPAEDHLLSLVQGDILNLRDRGEQQDVRLVCGHDTSIQIHCCHSPMREVEVLYDRLVDMFDSDPGLAPRDILVMVPDIEAYAPYIETVFATPAGERARVPYSTADQSMRRESHAIDAFLAILELWGGRFSASQVIDILQSEAVRRMFDLEETDLELIRKWVRETRIRWGIDAEDRKTKDLPAFAENTWKSGIERLLLGYAMPMQDQQVFHGIVPYDDIEGTDALILGRFVEFLDRLFKRVSSLGRPRPVKVWSEDLSDLLESLFRPDESAQAELQTIRATLKELSEIADQAQFHQEIDLRVVKNSLRRRLEQEAFAFGFMTGGVTFCAMLPMRSIPRKVICLLGMNNDAYPRQTKSLGFDLMARHPLKGDRSRRNDDRYLFLEAILSARETLYISYVGQSIQDNSLMPPSVLVSELIDYIKSGFAMPEEDILSRLITQHRLQAFSPEYFSDVTNKLFSYSRENYKAAEQMLQSHEPPVPFISSGLTLPEEQWKEVTLRQLSQFFANPARYLLNNRLGVHLQSASPAMAESEPFAMDGLEAYALAEELVQLKLDGFDPGRLFPVKKAAGLLPHGTPGECTYTALAHAVVGFAGKTEAYIQDKIAQPLVVELEAAGFRLTGSIASIYGDRLVHYRFAKLKPKDHLRLWIQHLIFSLVVPHVTQPSLVIGLSSTGKDPQWTAFEYIWPARPREILAALLEIYWQGLVKPIHFFPDAGWNYAEMVLQRGKSPEDGIRKAESIWQGSDYGPPGESRDPYYELCFRHANPIDAAFERLARVVWDPLLHHQREVKR